MKYWDLSEPLEKTIKKKVTDLKVFNIRNQFGSNNDENKKVKPHPWTKTNSQIPLQTHTSPKNQTRFYKFTEHQLLIKTKMSNIAHFIAHISTKVQTTQV